MTEENYEQLTKEEIETIILNIFKNPATKLFSYNNSETLLLSKKDTPSFYTEQKKTNVNLNSKTNILQQQKNEYPLMNNVNGWNYQNMLQGYIPTSNGKFIDLFSENNKSLDNSINSKELFSRKYNLPYPPNAPLLNGTLPSQDSFIQKLIRDESTKSNDKKMEDLKSMSQILNILNNNNTPDKESTPSFKKKLFNTKAHQKEEEKAQKSSPLEVPQEKLNQCPVPPMMMYNNPMMSSQDSTIIDKNSQCINNQNLFNYFTFSPNNINLYLQQLYPYQNGYYLYDNPYLYGGNVLQNPNVNTIDNTYVNLAQQLNQLNTLMSFCINNKEKQL